MYTREDRNRMDPIKFQHTFTPYTLSFIIDKIVDVVFIIGVMLECVRI